MAIGRACFLVALACAATDAFGRTFVPQDKARVAEIAAMLVDRYAGEEPPASDRACWDAQAATPAGRKVLKKAEHRLASPIAETTDALYLEFSTPGNGNRTHYEKPYFDRERGLNELVRGECLEHRGRFMQRIAEYLDTLCSEKTWCMPAHDPSLTAFRGESMRLDLGAQGRGLSCARALHALRGELPPALADRVEAELERRIFVPCRKCHAARVAKDVDPLWWYQSINNWTAVCQAGTVRTALLILKDKMDRAAFIEGAERAAASYLSGFTDDGYCSEGMGYWNYGWGHFLELAHAVRAATGGKVDFCSGEKARKVMEFGFSALICGTRAPAVADNSGILDMKVLRSGLEFWPDLPVPGETPLPLRSAFPIAQMYVMRPGGSGTPFALGVKGGHNGEFHNHNDVGTYDLYCDGIRLAGDPGGVQYTALTFSARRYENPILSSYGHPVPVVDGRLQGTGREFCAKVEKVSDTPQADRIRLDLSAAYPAATDGAARVVELRRVFDYDRERRTVRVVDRVAFDGEGTFAVPIVTFGELAPAGAEGEYALTASEDGREVKASVKVTVAGAKWHLVSERIDNPMRRSPMRHAIALDGPVRTATVSVVYAVSAGADGASQTGQ